MGQVGTWKLRPSGIATVTGLELRQRARSKKWYVALALWGLFNLGVCLLSYGGIAVFANELSAVQWRHVSTFVFSFSAIMTIFALLLVLPAMSAGAINGDRKAGTLAPLQVTLVSPAEIITGKIVAGWIVGLVFIAIVMPILGVVGLASGAGIFYLFRLFISLALVALYVVVVGVGLSSLTQRQLGSVVLAYIVTMGTTLILPVICILVLPVVTVERTVTTHTVDYRGSVADAVSEHGYAVDDARGVCVKKVEREKMPVSEVTVPLLAINPVFLVANSSGGIDQEVLKREPGESRRVDGLQVISEGMRVAANPTHPAYHNSCGDTPMADGSKVDIDYPAQGLNWLWGNLGWIAISVGAFVFSVYRARVPIGRLPKGQRIA